VLSGISKLVNGVK